MKLASKIFLCTLAVVVLALAASGYLIISSSFQNAVDRECERSLEEYQRCNGKSDADSRPAYGKNRARWQSDRDFYAGERHIVFGFSRGFSI